MNNDNRGSEICMADDHGMKNSAGHVKIEYMYKMNTRTEHIILVLRTH